MHNLHHGLHQFKTEVHSINEEFFGKLAKGQNPEAVFVTCSDSRVVPNLLTQTDPGELFIVRNAGNVVPPHGKSVSGEEATIEFALEALKIRHIIVCGHTKCGAMAGLLQPEKTRNYAQCAKMACLLRQDP